ncbi:hypothetical protein [Mycobacterium kyogaense]|uniref:hypothetical protein n=1 Tax=Mycobacterium kyogaense TaxID=2212479 RepID=UPI0019695FA8|nr:hypothetical protein [Mycobacterium kyogaense]
MKQAAGEKASQVADSVQDKADEVKSAVAENAPQASGVAVAVAAGAVLVAVLLLRRRRSASGRRHKGRKVATKAVSAGLKEAIAR